MVTLNGYSISNYRQMKGRDGYIMQGTLCKGRKKIADFFDDGNGGQMDFNVIDQTEWAKAQEEALQMYNRHGMFTDKDDFGMMPIFIEEIVVYGEMHKMMKSKAKAYGYNQVLVTAVTHVKGYEKFKAFRSVGISQESYIRLKQELDSGNRTTASKIFSDGGFVFRDIAGTFFDTSSRNLAINL